MHAHCGKSANALPAATQREGDTPMGTARMEAITSGKYSDILITVHCWKTKQAKEVDKKSRRRTSKNTGAKSILPVCFICIAKLYTQRERVFALPKIPVCLLRVRAEPVGDFYLFTI